jgi:hypothetical protein
MVAFSANTSRLVNVAKREKNMNTYVAFYRGQKITIQAETSYKAQLAAANIFRAKKSYDVTVVLADRPVETASI